MSEPEMVENYPVVGVGASAGGLEALFTLLENVEVSSGLALVILQHGSPDQESSLPKLLARHCELPVHQITGGEQPRTDQIYVAPPGRDLELRSGVFHLAEQSSKRTPIDHFFRSLASELGSQCAGVVLSGMGSDGTAGLKAIREKGGLTVAQEPTSASYSAMPLSAIEGKAARLVLKPDEIIFQLAAHFREPHAGPDFEKLDTILPTVLELIKSQTGRDFSSYKEATIKRRVHNRLCMLRLSSGEDYLTYLQRDLGEVDRLAGDLLVGVTCFFRDPEAFRQLEKHVFPALVSSRSAVDTIRIWVPGCSTGEEAYSIAILLSEYLERENRSDQRFTIFATDLDPEAIETARAACYSPGLAQNIPSGLVQKYFTTSGEKLELTRDLRVKLTFAVHSVFKDPPFSRMDLVSCRNLLIYLQPELQQNVISLLHYSLRVGGFLLLGSAEGLGPFLDHFEYVDRQWKLYRKLPSSGRPQTLTLPPFEGAPPQRARVSRSGLRSAVEQTLLEHCCPTAVVTDSRGTILYIHGDSEPFLVPPRGEADFSLLRMAREELKAPLMSLVAASVKGATPATIVSCLGEDPRARIEVELRPFQEKERAQLPLLLFLFRYHLDQESSGGGPDRSRVGALEKELESSRAYLRTTIEELETTNEELQTLNEEFQCANEELHSANEELETSREELLSGNEELALVNQDLQKQVESGRADALELANFLSSTELAVIQVDSAGAIRRFTPAASGVVSLQACDLGRPLEDLSFRLELRQEDLVREVHHVIQSHSTVEIEVRSREAQWYALKIIPYHSATKLMDGAILVFVNVTAQKAEGESFRLASETAGHAPQSLMMLDREGKIVYRNPHTPRKVGERPDFWKAYQAQTGGTGPWHSVTRLLDGNGGLARREILVNPVLDEGGRTLTVVASEMIREESQSLFEVMGGHLLFLDAEGSIIRVNRELSELLGLSQESLRGRDWMKDFILETDRDKARPFFLSSQGPGDSCEARILTPGGPLLFHWRALALAEVSSGENGRICAGENITELHRARRTISRSKGLMRAFRILNKSVHTQQTETSLLSTVCEVLVEEAGYVRAWVGFVDLDSVTAMEPVVAVGQAARSTRPAVLLAGVLEHQASGPRPFVHRDLQRGIVTIVLPLAFDDTLGLLELDSDWEDFVEDEVEALRQFSAGLTELLNFKPR